MRRALLPDEGIDTDSRLIHLALLPGLCCQAAGGDLRWADRIAAAWFLFYAAADIMDCVQDQDAPQPWWGDHGPATALSVATGLYFSASRLLNEMHLQGGAQGPNVELVSDFYNGFLTMSSGQYLDLDLSEPTLDQYWEIAQGKSGIFFSLACRSGASLATLEPKIIDAYDRFGRHLGLLVQISDDVNEFLTSGENFLLNSYPTLRRSLPVIFALEVCPLAQRGRLLERLRMASDEAPAAQEAYQIIEGSGAVLFITTEMERHRSLAMACLEQAGARAPARHTLASLVDMLALVK
jgi:geranylgeranyl pyrophosphate synthase